MADIVRVNAGALSEALADAYPKRKKTHKPTPITLAFDQAGCQLAVIEAKYGAFQYAITASGTWPEEGQLDGVALARMVMTFASDAELALSVEADALVVRHKGSTVRIARLDGPGNKPIKRTAPRPDRRHTGKPHGADDPLGPDRPQQKTWDFSAHMALKRRQDDRG